jgi:DNA-binding NarL/FixJ family response regulator
MESAAVGEGSGVSSAVVGSGTAPRQLITVWMVDGQPLYQELVATALLATSDVVLSNYFVHPEDALLFNNGAQPPNLILIDVQQFGSSGIQALREFRAAFPGAFLFVLTESVEETVICASVCAGASGYLLKSSSMDLVVKSIREVVAGGACLAPVATRMVLEMFRRFSGSQQTHGLTARELSILELMGQDLVMKEIAERLAVSYHTVDAHLRNIYAKLGVRSRTGAVAKALRERII